jgi:hypothetical protein
MVRMTIRLLGVALLVLACTSTRPITSPPAASSASMTCPGNDARSASVTCRAGYLPDCGGCTATSGPFCHCVPASEVAGKEK